MTSRVQKRDRGAARRLAAIRDVDAKITIGVHEDDGARPHTGSGGATISQVATYVELGTEDTPIVPFVRGTVDASSAYLGALVREAGIAILRGAPSRLTYAQAFEPVAEEMRRRVPVLSGELRDAIRARVGGR